ncbi:MAG: Ig-like domain-containing protein [Pseudomonadota bacterium]
MFKIWDKIGSRFSTLLIMLFLSMAVGSCSGLSDIEAETETEETTDTGEITTQTGSVDITGVKLVRVDGEKLNIVNTSLTTPIPLNVKVEITFALTAPDSIGDYFSLVDQDINVIEGTTVLSHDCLTLTFTPLNGLKPNTTYTVVMSASGTSASIQKASSIQQTFTTMVSGDYDGDRIPDLVIGADSIDTAYLISGARLTAEMLASNTGVMKITGTGGNLGGALSLGDVNCDGYADIVVAEENYSGGYGAVHVISGLHALNQRTAGFSQILSSEAFFRVQGVANTDNLGYALTIGDINGDGCSDVIATSQAHAFYSGAVYIFYGGQYLTGNRYASRADVIINGGAVQSLGCSVSAADINNDSYDDLLIGATFGETAYLIFGDDLLAPLISAPTDSDLQIDASGGSFGWSVSAGGDFNGDGYNDFVVGAPSFDITVDEGRAYLFFGGDTDILQGTWNADVDADVIVTGEAANDRLGRGISNRGDINGDGLADLAVSSYNASPGGVTSGGKVYIILGSSDLLGILGMPGDAVSTIVGNEAYDRIGFTLALDGDFNSDGKSDLIVGSQIGGSVPARPGEASIFSGAILSLPGENDQFSNAFVRITGTQNDDNFGSAVSD